MKHKVDIDKWERRELYAFFRDFDEPYYGISTDLDCTEAYNYAKSRDLSFFYYYLYLVLRAVNRIQSFRYRIEGEELFLYDEIHASATIDRPDGTFGFSLIPYKEDLEEFLLAANKEVLEVRASRQLMREGIGENVIHFSAIPWIRFTSLSHPRHFRRRDSIPKVSIGKYYMLSDRRMIPVSVHIHHGLADGLHVGQFFQELQDLFHGA